MRRCLTFKRPCSTGKGAKKGPVIRHEPEVSQEELAARVNLSPELRGQRRA